MLHLRLSGSSAVGTSGVRADTGSIKIGSASVSPASNYVFNNYFMVVSVSSGGIVSTMDRVSGAGYTVFTNIAPSVVQIKDGSVIYTGQ